MIVLMDAEERETSELSVQTLLFVVFLLLLLLLRERERERGGANPAAAGRSDITI